MGFLPDIKVINRRVITLKDSKLVRLVQNLKENQITPFIEKIKQKLKEEYNCQIVLPKLNGETDDKIVSLSDDVSSMKLIAAEIYLRLKFLKIFPNQSYFPLKNYLAYSPKLPKKKTISKLHEFDSDDLEQALVEELKIEIPKFNQLVRNLGVSESDVFSAEPNKRKEREEDEEENERKKKKRKSNRKKK